jgi:DNA-directed RNA polymerase specialized sigma24 family protein
VPIPWTGSDENFLRSYIFRYRGAIAECGLEEEDVAQDVRLSLVSRPLPETLTPASRRWNVRNRLVDVLHRHSVRSTSNGSTGAKGRFLTGMRSWDEIAGRGAHYEDTDDYTDALMVSTGQYVLPHDPEPWLLRAVDALPEPQRVVIRSLFWDDLTCTEAAAGLGVTRQAVWLRKSHALKNLRKALR